VQGLILGELQKYVETKYASGTWDRVVRGAGVQPRAFLATEVYPDSEMEQLVASTSKLSGKPVPVVLYEFGEFIVPHLIGMFGFLIRPAWKTLEAIENTESVIHKMVRTNHPGARPAEINCTRLGPDSVLIRYTSKRRMCGIAKGIVKGLARHFGETVRITESSCMLEGAPACKITVQRITN
jgi:hypothetical protein